MEPDRTEIAWAAGLFEGEGAICQDKNGRVRLSLKMTDQDCVYQFCDIVGGKVYGPYHYEAKDGYPRSPFWQWHSDKGANPRTIIHMFWPWLQTRRRARALAVGLGEPAESRSIRTGRKSVII